MAGGALPALGHHGRSRSPPSKPPLVAQHFLGLTPFCPPTPSGWGKRGPPLSVRKLAFGIPLEGVWPPSLPVDVEALHTGASSSSRGRTARGASRGRGGPTDDGTDLEGDPRATPRVGRAGSPRRTTPRKTRPNTSPAKVPSPKVRVPTRGLPLDASTGSLSATAGAVGSRDSGTQLLEVCRVLRDELGKCASLKEVQRFANVADRIIHSGASDTFTLTGGIAYRLREVMRSLRHSNYAALGGQSCLSIQKALTREVERRRIEITHGKDALPLLLPPLYAGAAPSHQEPATPSSQPEVQVRSRPTLQLPALEASAREVERVASLETTSSPGQATSKASDRPPTEPLRRTSSFLQMSPSGGDGGERRRFPMSIIETSPGEVEAPKTIDKRWVLAFERCKRDGQIHRDGLRAALDGAGFPKADQGSVDEALYKVAGRCDSLCEEEFYQFIPCYLECLERSVDKAFEQYDADHSGLINREELERLLQAFGIDPMRHVLDEIIAECDEDGHGLLDRREFRTVMKIVREREGFTRGEYMLFCDLFHKFDRDRSGEIDPQELETVLAWLGYAVNRNRINEIIKEVDANKNGSFSAEEFLLFMRRIREFELQTIARVARESDTDGDGVISMQSEIQTVLAALGYLPNLEAIYEAADEAGIARDAPDVDLGEIWRLLTVFRAREGFIEEEAQDIEEAFLRFDKEGNLKVDLLEANKVLRWLGYTTSFEVIQQLVAKIDPDGSGHLGLIEMRKLVRMFQDQELQHIRETFADLDAKGTGFITVEDARRGFRKLGCIDALGNIPQMLEFEKPGAVDRACISWDSFVSETLVFQRAMRQAFRQNGGFTWREQDDLREKFAVYDFDSSGDIKQQELAILIQDLFPSIAHDASLRPKIQVMLQEMDTDGGGSLDFKEFVQFMGRVRDIEQREKLDKERRAADKTQFLPREVEDFRELFLARSEDNQALSVSDVHRLLGTICPLGDKNAAELNSHILEVTGRPVLSEMGHVSVGAEILHDACVDFPEFLLLMRRLLDANFANLNAPSQ